MARNKTYNICVSSLRAHLDGGFSYDSYALFVLVKFRFTNSRVYDCSPERLMRLFGMGRAQAAKVYAEACRCPLFRRDGNVLVAKSARSRVGKTSKKGVSYTGDMVYKAERKMMSLRDTVFLLKRVLLEYVVGIADGNILRTKRGSLTLDERYDTRGTGIRQGTMADILNVGKSELGRLVNYIATRGWIFKTEQKRVSVPLEAVGSFAMRSPYGKMYVRNGVAYYGFVCGYALDTGEERRFTHVIWNHRKRVGKAS